MRKLPGGEEITIIYLKMMLASLAEQGKEKRRLAGDGHLEGPGQRLLRRPQHPHHPAGGRRCVGAGL